MNDQTNVCQACDYVGETITFTHRGRTFEYCDVCHGEAEVEAIEYDEYRALSDEY